MLPDYHKSLNVLHYNCKEPRACFVPFSSVESARSGDRTKSRYFRSLCGKWDFNFYPSVEKFISLDTDFSDTITVPFCWQMLMGKGYDVPHYTNANYVFPINPPNVPETNPCGLYRRFFLLDKNEIENKKIYINFEGVDSCFYMWINGEFSAYSQVSHSTSEIDITPLVHEGENEIKVLVLKWCDGSYLECQDKYRLSGIFREVYLLFRDEEHIEDFFVTQLVSETFTEAELTVSITGAEALSKTVTLLDANITVFERMFTGDEISFTFSAPHLWSDEDPYLYTLLIECGNETIRQPIGLGRTEIKDGFLLRNGKKIKLKGVNHHDTNPETGYCLSYSDMERDVRLMKQNNINTVRTSHYPPPPQFLDLCDIYGLYVIDETDLESHGFIYYNNDPGYLSKQPEWLESYLDRVQRCFNRDKNHACVLMWSLGNEAGFGDNHREMSKYLASVDINKIGQRQRLIHYEGLNSTYTDNEKDISYTDTDSFMYSDENFIKKWLTEKRYKKPLFLCEYSHAMGNSNGDLYDYWTQIYSEDRFCGACVWEFADHAVNIGTKDDPKYIYGGEFGETPHDGNFCVDGLFTPDRKPRSGVRELKQVVKPFRISVDNLKKGYFTIENLRYFIDFSDLRFNWQLTCQGEIVQKGIVSMPEVMPQEKAGFKIKYSLEKLKGFASLEITACTNSTVCWAEEGHIIGFESFILPIKRIKEEKPEKTGKPEFTETDLKININTEAGKYVFNKEKGYIESFVLHDGTVVISSPVLFNIRRAPLDNDMNIRLNWEREGIMDSNQKAVSVKTNLKSNKIITKTIIVDTNESEILSVESEYIFSDKGVKIFYSVKVKEDLTFLPRFGLAFEMPESFENIEFFGYGKGESYIDKHHYTKLGIYKTTVTENYEHNIVPQQSSDHFGTRYMKISDGRIIFTVKAKEPFSFNATHFGTEQLIRVKHDFELVRENKTHVALDYKMSGVGSNSCGPVLYERYQLCEKSFSGAFEISIEPKN